MWKSVTIVSKHEISRKKIGEREENNCMRKLSDVCNMFVIIII